jgi:hypothetical protein
MRKMNSNAKLAFYNARSRRGDITRIASETGYSTSHVCNVRGGRRSVNEELGNAFYNISRRRMRNSERFQNA